jgi:hypothetical protein
VTFLDANVTVPMVFDTGASMTTLRHTMYPLVGASDWADGAFTESQTAGDEALADSYQYDDVRVEVFGMEMLIPVNLMKLPPNPIFHGLFGREVAYEHFGFGFWERTRELFVTSSP